MRWETVSTTANIEVYDLWHNDKKLLTLTLHPFSNSARVDSTYEKRVFLIRKEGFRRHKTVLRNEYGIKLGELGLEEKGNFIDINNERFYYIIRNNPLPELILYKDSTDKPFVVCGLNVPNGDTMVHFQRDRPLTSQPGLLMALCWYMFLPMAKENRPEFAA
jgi:hypothetical protein